MSLLRDAFSAEEDTGPVGPVAVLAFLFLIAVSPLMRGGNRNVALIVIEGAALAFLGALLAGAGRAEFKWSLRSVLLLVLLSSPVWLAFVYLLPLPASLWSSLPGRDAYLGVLATAGIQPDAWLPISLVPDATEASVLAGIPLVAAFLAGFWMRQPQAEFVLSVFLAVAFMEVVFGLLQAAGGQSSSLYFGVAGGRPFGTFANPNHYANYLGMALAVYIWFASMRLTKSRREARAHYSKHAHWRRVAVWGAGGLVLMIGILFSRSRGSALAGLPAAMCALSLAIMYGSRVRSWRLAVLVPAILLLAAASMVGFELLSTRFSAQRLGEDAGTRSLLATTTLSGAWTFWPLGSGWGTFGAVYPRFQPPSIVGSAGYAHQDYAQILFEGGIFGVILMAAFAWLAGARAVELVKRARGRGRLRREEMASAICGLGLLGFLLHSLVEFNMHIPANAIIASLLAGIYLRPLEDEEQQRREPEVD